MSKTFEINAGKALTLAAGLHKHSEEVARLGITKEQVDRMESTASRAIEMSREVDSLREVVSQKLQAANELLAEVREQANSCRTLIKSNYPLEEWEKFGLMERGKTERPQVRKLSNKVISALIPLCGPSFPWLGIVQESLPSALARNASCGFSGFASL